VKTLVIALVVAAVVGLATFSFVSQQDTAKLNQAKAAWDAEKSQLASVSPKPTEPVFVEKVVTNTAAVRVEESAQEILNDLLAIKLGVGNDRNPALRKVVYKLEMLGARGETALPAIHSFSSQNIDVSYEPLAADAATGTNAAAADAAANSGGGRRNGFGGGQRGFAGRGEARRARDLQNFSANWVAPPTLRLGVITALKEIGGVGAEQELAYMLSTTGRGVEVAYLTVTLEQMAPGKYREAAIAAARELLMTPPSADNADRLDALAKSYLYGVLEFYKDTSFVVNAQQMLVGADGRLNNDALDYLSQTLKDQSVPAIYAAYKNPALTNQMDKFDLGRELVGYVGQNATANQFFTETLQNQDLDSRAKTFAIARLAGGGFGPGSTDAPLDPQVASSRIQLLTSLQPQFASDEQLSQMMTATITALQTGQPVDMRQLFGGGGRRAGNRTGGGGGTPAGN
jgi:hypothetical protein